MKRNNPFPPRLLRRFSRKRSKSLQMSLPIPSGVPIETTNFNDSDSNTLHPSSQLDPSQKFRIPKALEGSSTYTIISSSGFLQFISTIDFNSSIEILILILYVLYYCVLFVIPYILSIVDTFYDKSKQAKIQIPNVDVEVERKKIKIWKQILKSVSVGINTLILFLLLIKEFAS